MLMSDDGQTKLYTLKLEWCENEILYRENKTYTLKESNSLIMQM